MATPGASCRASVGGADGTGGRGMATAGSSPSGVEALRGGATAGGPDDTRRGAAETGGPIDGTAGKRDDETAAARCDAAGRLGATNDSTTGGESRRTGIETFGGVSERRRIGSPGGRSRSSDGPLAASSKSNEEPPPAL